MTFVDWSRMDAISDHGLRSTKRMTEEEFVAECAYIAGTTPEHVREYHDIVLCECGEPGCPGWLAEWKHSSRRRNEG